MSQLWSEINKVVNVLSPVSLTSGTGTIKNTDVVNMENYKKCTFLLTFGIAAQHKAAVTVNAYSENTTGGSPIAFHYRTQTTTDLQGDPTSAETFNTSSGSAGATYIVEVDASTVLAESPGSGYNHCYMVITNSTGSHYARIASCVAVLSEPRYPQNILQTAID